MTSAFGDLTPYERRREYYANIQLGKDVETQSKLLKNQTRAMIVAQAASTSSIVASQESINENLNNLSYGIEDIRNGMYGLKAAFEFGISEVVWQIEQNRQILKNILETLMAPLDTQAKELRSRAEDAYANGWYDDALEDFLESEKKNKYDFAVQISIGLIHLFHYVDREKAYEYFEKATKYAKPKSHYHASFALLHSALIKRDLDEFTEAEKLTAEAIALTPDFAEALYQNAQYNAQLKDVSKCIIALEKAVKLDRNYCVKADNDEMFVPVKNEVDNLFERLRDEIRPSSISFCNKIDTVLKETTEFISTHRNVFNGFRESATILYSRVSDIRSMLDRNNYFDCLNAQPLIKSLFEDGKEFIQSTDKYLTSHFTQKISAIESSIRNSTYSDERDTREGRDRIADSGGLGCLIWVILVFGSMFLANAAMESKKFDQLESGFIIAILVFIFGGWHIAKWILRKVVAPIIHPENDLSGFITDRQQEIEELQRNKRKLNDKFKFSSKLERARDLSKLVKQLEDKSGVFAVEFNAGTMPADDATAKEQTKFDIILETFGDKKINVIKEVRAITGLGLKEAKALVEAVPKVVKEGVSKYEADKIKRELEGAGALVTVK